MSHHFRKILVSQMRTAVAMGVKTAGGYKPTKNDLKRVQPWDDSRHIRELISDLVNRAAESFEMLCAYFATMRW